MYECVLFRFCSFLVCLVLCFNVLWMERMLGREKKLEGKSVMFYSVSVMFSFFCFGVMIENGEEWNS